MKDKDDIKKYGEFICSEFNWITCDKQREKCDKLANLTNERKNDKKKFKP